MVNPRLTEHHPSAQLTLLGHKEEVLGLEVPVRYVVLMHIVDGTSAGEKNQTLRNQSAQQICLYSPQPQEEEKNKKDKKNNKN